MMRLHPQKWNDNEGFPGALRIRFCHRLASLTKQEAREHACLAALEKEDMHE